MDCAWQTLALAGEREHGTAGGLSTVPVSAPPASHAPTPALPRLPLCPQKRAAELAAGDLDQAGSANAARKGTTSAGNPFSKGSQVPTSNEGQAAKPRNVWERLTRGFIKQG